MENAISKSSKVLITNVVSKDKMREFQIATLRAIKEALTHSFGPMGSNTIIASDREALRYSKDGHTILENIRFQDIIEESVRTDIVNITREIVKKVGDGTTSATILSSIIFEELTKLEGEASTPYELIKVLKNCTSKIIDKILSAKQEFTPELAYKIALVSTNGNEEMALNLKNIYEEFGKDVFIDVGTSVTDETYLKTYDGMTLDEGFDDMAYVNDSKKGTVTLRNPEIYAFEDPIDTPEMVSFLDSIIYRNIYQPSNENRPTIPTVILAPKVSRDLSSLLGQLVSFLYKFDKDNEKQKPQIVIVSGIQQQGQYSDLARLCGCKSIKKYIDLSQQQIDIEKGLAPTPETISNFAGSADLVEADSAHTKFVNPKDMYDEEGKPSQTFNSIKQFLEAELKGATERGEDANITGRLKRRINSLNANLVELLIGGISVSDRDSIRYLVEDAVLNCRSAAKYGVGYGANFEGFKASKELSINNNDKDNELEAKMYELIHDAYNELLLQLYKTAFTEDRAKEIIKDSEDMPYNIKSKMYDKDLVSSIQSDAVILKTVTEIVSIMFTANQFICPSIASNRYLKL